MTQEECAQWNSHKLLFDKISDRLKVLGRDKLAVEAGSGFFSTAYLAEFFDKVISIENNPQYYDIIKEDLTHQLSNLEYIQWPANGTYDADLWTYFRDWELGNLGDANFALVDNSGSRPKCVVELMNAGVRYIMAHDFEGDYGWQIVEPWKTGHKLHICRDHAAWSALWTTDHELWERLERENPPPSYGMPIQMATITMNAGEDIPGSTLKYNLQMNAKYFDRVIITDGNLTKEAEKYYAQFPNLTIVDRKWEDKFVYQYQAAMQQVTAKEWTFLLDDDEVPCNDLRDWLRFSLRDPATAQFNAVRVRPALMLADSRESWRDEEGKTWSRYYRCSPLPKEGGEVGFTRKVIRKEPTFTFLYSEGEYHATPAFIQEFGGQQLNAENSTYIHFPYYHFKTIESYVINDCLNALVSPKGERYTEEEGKTFREILTKDGILTRKDFVAATKAGWSAELKKFAVDHCHHTDRPISRLYWWYYVLAHPGEAGNIPGGIISRDDVFKMALGEETWDMYIESRENNDFVEVFHTPLD